MKGRQKACSITHAENNTDAVLCRSFLRSVEELNPLFTVFVPEQGCPEMVHRAVYNYVADVRDRQEYRTILWELFGDHLHIDRIISDTPCSAEIDENGFLYPLGSPKTVCNCFEHSLQDMLKEMFPKLSVNPITWVYLQTDRGGQRKCLKQGCEPVVSFALLEEKPVAVYAYCNLHGMWKTEI